MVLRGKYTTILLYVGIFLVCLPKLSASSSTKIPTGVTPSPTQPTTTSPPTTTPPPTTTTITTTPATTTITTTPTTTPPTTTPATTPTPPPPTTTTTPTTTTPTTTPPTTTTPTPTTTTPTTTTPPPTTTPTTTTTNTTTTTSTTRETTDSTLVSTKTPTSATSDVTATATSSSSAIATSSSSATVSSSSSATVQPSLSATASPSSSATAPPSSSPTAPPSSSTTAAPTTTVTTAAPPSSSTTAAPTTTVTTAAPEAYPDKPINKESYFDLEIAFSYRDSVNASTIVAELTDVFKNTSGFRKVVLNTTPNRVRRDTTLTDKFTVSFDADVIQNNTEFNSTIRQNFDTLRGVVIFGDNINNTIDEFISKTSDICQANFVCETAYECVSGGMCRYRCKDKCTGTEVCSILVNTTMITTKCSRTAGPVTQAPSATSNNDDERLVQVAVPLAVVLFLVILALIYACHKLHRHKHNGGEKSYSMSKL